MILSYNLKLKICRWTPKQSPDNLGCSCVGVNCLVMFQKLFSFFYPFLKPLNISLKFTFTPTLRNMLEYVLSKSLIIHDAISQPEQFFSGQVDDLGIPTKDELKTPCVSTGLKHTWKMFCSLHINKPSSQNVYLSYLKPLSISLEGSSYRETTVTRNNKINGT